MYKLKRDRKVGVHLVRRRVPSYSKVCVATRENVGDNEGFSAATAEDLLGEVLEGRTSGFLEFRH